MKIVYNSWVGREEQFVSNVDFDQTFVFLVLIMFLSIALSVWFSSPQKKKKSVWFSKRESICMSLGFSCVEGKFDNIDQSVNSNFKESNDIRDL